MVLKSTRWATMHTRNVRDSGFACARRGFVPEQPLGDFFPLVALAINSADRVPHHLHRERAHESIRGIHRWRGPVIRVLASADYSASGSSPFSERLRPQIYAYNFQDQLLCIERPKAAAFM